MAIQSGITPFLVMSSSPAESEMSALMTIPGSCRWLHRPYGAGSDVRHLVDDIIRGWCEEKEFLAT